MPLEKATWLVITASHYLIVVGDRATLWASMNQTSEDVETRAMNLANVRPVTKLRLLH